MKDGWQTKRLGDLCEIELGKTPARANKSFWDEKRETNNVWLSIADLLSAEDNIVVDSKEYLSNKGAAISKIVPKGTLLVSFKLTLGRLAFAGRDLFTNEAIAALTIRNELELSKEFLFYFLYFFDWRKAAENDVKLKGMTLNKAKLKEVLVRLPSPAEQRWIVSMLDKAFESISSARADAEKNLSNARALFASHLNSIFVKRGPEWVEKKLGDVCKTGAGGTPLKSKKEYYEGGSIPWLMSGEVNQGEVLSATKFITQKGFDNSSAKLFPKDTVLVAMYGATAGAVGILRFEATTNQAVCGILPNDKFIPEFLFYVLLAKKSELVNQATGNAQPNISQIKIRNTEIPVISLPEQRRIVKQLDALRGETRHLESIYQRKLLLLEEVKKELLRKAFAGELVKSEVSVPSMVQGAVPSPYIRNQIHAAIIDQTTKDGGWTTEVAVAKYDHLLQEVYGLSLGYQFAQHQFGPFDAQIKRLIASGLGRNKWFSKKNGMIAYGSNVDALLSRQSNLYQAARSKMQELSALGVTKLDADKVELLSTVCHSIKETGSTSLDKIRDFMSQWPTDRGRMKTDKFSLEQTQKCLDFILNNNLHQALQKKI